MENELRQNLLDLAAAYSAATDKSLPTIGKLALNDNTFLTRIEGGDGFNVKTFDKMVAWFSDNWPDKVRWPKGVTRPRVSEAAQ